MKIEVYGTGCANCRKLEENVRKAVKELNVKAEVVKVEDIQKIIERGIMMTPALFIDNKESSVGRVPDVTEIKKMISTRKV